MLEVAAEQVPDASFVQGDALDLPFDDGAFDRVFTSYFYCHLEEAERERFLAEARRVAPRARRRRAPALPGEELATLGAAGPQRRDASGGLQALLHAERSSPPSSAAAGPPRGPLVRDGRPRLDAAPLVVPLARLAPARQPRLPRLRRGRLPARVAAGARGPRRPARVHLRPGAGDRRGRASAGRGAAAPARPSAAGSSSTRTSSTRPSTAPRSRAATRAGPLGLAATASRRRASRSSARSGSTGSCGCSGRSSSSPSAASRSGACSGCAASTASARRSSAAARPSSRSPTPPASAAGRTSRRTAHGSTARWRSSGPGSTGWRRPTARLER